MAAPNRFPNAVTGEVTPVRAWLVVALLWMVHPVQTGAVTYIAHRAGW